MWYVLQNTQSVNDESLWTPVEHNTDHVLNAPCVLQNVKFIIVPKNEMHMHPTMYQRANHFLHTSISCEYGTSSTKSKEPSPNGCVHEIIAIFWYFWRKQINNHVIMWRSWSFYHYCNLNTSPQSKLHYKTSTSLGNCCKLYVCLYQLPQRLSSHYNRPTLYWFSITKTRRKMKQTQWIIVKFTTIYF